MDPHYKYTLLFLILLFGGCASSVKMVPANAEIAYRLIYVIHGDASYDYHMEGRAHEADLKVLQEAFKVAEQAGKGEVFIFHQKPERSRFLFFPGKDRKWYHFVNGDLVGESSYSSSSGGLEREAAIYRQQRSSREVRTVFQYFGHEIPTGSFTAYHRSQPGLEFNSYIFSQDLPLFEEHFALTLLSTCNNGNPLMANLLSGRTRYLVASPRNLHLSHLDTHKLLLLDSGEDIDMGALADSVAHSSFQRLATSLQTMVTVGVYDLQAARPYLPDLSQRYQEHLKEIQQRTLFEDNTDCSGLSEFGEGPLPQKGTHLYFQAPAFGREARIDTHSAWGCKN